MKKLHPWMECVYQHMLTHGERLSARDAAMVFGEPRDTTAARLMHSAMHSGYFTCIFVQYEGRHGPASRAVFTAVKRQGCSDNPCSVQRAVSSVWQFAEAMS